MWSAFQLSILEKVEKGNRFMISIHLFFSKRKKTAKLCLSNWLSVLYLLHRLWFLISVSLKSLFLSYAIWTILTSVINEISVQQQDDLQKYLKDVWVSGFRGRHLHNSWRFQQVPKIDLLGPRLSRNQSVELLQEVINESWTLWDI